MGLRATQVLHRQIRQPRRGSRLHRSREDGGRLLLTEGGGRGGGVCSHGAGDGVGSGEAALHRRGRAAAIAAAAQEEEEGYVARVSQELQASSIYTEWAQHPPSNCKSTCRNHWASWAVLSLLRK
jgi:hypothetical protein